MGIKGRHNNLAKTCAVNGGVFYFKRRAKRRAFNKLLMTPARHKFNSPVGGNCNTLETWGLQLEAGRTDGLDRHKLSSHTSAMHTSIALDNMIY